MGIIVGCRIGVVGMRGVGVLPWGVQERDSGIDVLVLFIWITAGVLTFELSKI